ncbi:UNVERIFIED_CONTAM: Sortase and related acyltransferases [Acetivibrio alkalicellulosi]
MLKIREIEQKDLKEISVLLSEFEEGMPDLDKMKLIYMNYQQNKDYIYLCAELNNKIVGTLTGVVCHSLFTQFSPFMILENVIVLKEKRGTGIGKALIKRIVSVIYYPHFK